MNILNRFLLALAFCSIGILVAFEVSFDETRNGALCREVANKRAHEASCFTSNF